MMHPYKRVMIWIFVFDAIMIVALIITIIKTKL